MRFVVFDSAGFIQSFSAKQYCTGRGDESDAHQAPGYRPKCKVELHIKFSLVSVRERINHFELKKRHWNQIVLHRPIDIEQIHL